MPCTASGMMLFSLVSLPQDSVTFLYAAWTTSLEHPLATQSDPVNQLLMWGVKDAFSSYGPAMERQ